MPRYLKTFDQALVEIARSLWIDLGQEADLVEGSVLRSLGEGVSFQSADLSDRQERAIDDAVPEAVFKAFGFPRKLAEPAQGTLRIFAAGPGAARAIEIGAGTEALTDGNVSFVTLVDSVLPLGAAWVDIPALAATPGAIGNVPAGAVNRLTFSPPGIGGVTNPQPFRDGEDAETLAQQTARFHRRLVTLDQSTRPGLKEALLEARLPTRERLQAAKVVDADNDENILPGRMVAYVYRLGGVPTALMELLRDIVAARRSAGALPLVIETVGTPVPVTAVLSARAAGVGGPAREALGAYFAGLQLGEKVSYENLVTVLTKSSPDITEVTLTSPSADVPPASPYVKFDLGSVLLSEDVA